MVLSYVIIFISKIGDKQVIDYCLQIDIQIHEMPSVCYAAVFKGNLELFKVLKAKNFEYDLDQAIK